MIRLESTETNTFMELNFLYVFPFDEDVGVLLHKREFPSTKNTLC